MLTPESELAPGVSESRILHRVRSFVQENPLYDCAGVVVSDDGRLLGRAELDSKYVAAMVTFVEQEFGVFVSPCEISEENFGSLRAVAHFVACTQPFAVG